MMEYDSILWKLKDLSAQRERRVRCLLEEQSPLIGGRGLALHDRLSWKRALHKIDSLYRV